MAAPFDGAQQKKRIQFGFEKKKKGPRHLNSNPNWVKEWMKERKVFGLEEGPSAPNPNPRSIRIREEIGP